MSEDVKPKLYYVYKGIAYEINNGRSLLEDVCAPIDRFNMKTIELEPTMRLMDEMAETMRTASPYEYNDFSEVLEKYKKFKDGLK